MKRQLQPDINDCFYLGLAEDNDPDMSEGMLLDKAGEVALWRTIAHRVVHSLVDPAMRRLETRRQSEQIGHRHGPHREGVAGDQEAVR